MPTSSIEFERATYITLSRALDALSAPEHCESGAYWLVHDARRIACPRVCHEEAMARTARPLN